MSIQNKRVDYLTEKILEKNLQNGLLPDSQEFVWQLNQALYHLNSDKSSFLFKPYRNTEILTSKKINEDNEQVYEDLKILYDNNEHIRNVLNREYQYFLIKKKKLEKELDIEENRLVQYIQNSTRSGFLPYAYDTFDTTHKVNLNQTGQVFVDTNNNRVHIVEEKNASRRIYPSSDITFNLYPHKMDLKEVQVEGELEYMLRDTEDTVWQKQILLKENIEVDGNLIVMFDRSHLMNTIHFSLLTVKPVNTKVEFTPDGESWYHLPYYEDYVEVEKEITLDFPSVEIKGLRFILNKQEADESLPEDEDYDYQYLFGIEKIEFYDKSYPTSGVFQSQPLELENRPKNYAIDTVQLYTDDWIPTGTDIQYQIALPEENPDWQRISPMNHSHPRYSQKVHFHNLKRNHRNKLFFPEDLSIRQSEAEDLLKNGIPLYKLSHMFGHESQFYIPKLDIVEGSFSLYVGREHAEVISYPADDSIVKVEDFLQIRDFKKHYYQPLTNIDSGDIFTNHKEDQHRKHLVRIGLYLEKPMNITAAPISTEDIKIHLNGNELYNSIVNTSNTVHYTFSAGWNELVILVDGKNGPTVNGMSVSLGFNFYHLTDRVYSSSSSLKEVDLFELQNNTKIHDRTVFAKREVDNGYEILTNFAQPGISFDLFYDYKEVFTDETKILLRADLTRENGNNVPTPIIRNYRLEFS